MTTLTYDRLPARRAASLPLTLIIPVHGRRGLLDRALASIARQEMGPIEVLVVDDASDPPVEISEQHRETLDIRLIRHIANKGAAAARNTGMRAAGTEWIAFLDSDDFLLDGSLSQRWNSATDGRNAPADSRLIHGCSWVDVDQAGRPLTLRRPRASDNPYDFASGCWFSPGSCVILNARAAMAVSPQDEQLSRFEDFDWFLALSLAGFSLRTIPAACVAIERRRRQDPVLVAEAAETIRRKWRRLSSDRQLLRRVDAYLDLEIAAARYYAGLFLGASRALARSYVRMPRLSLQFSPGWVTERALALPVADVRTS